MARIVRITAFASCVAACSIVALDGYTSNPPRDRTGCGFGGAPAGAVVRGARVSVRRMGTLSQAVRDEGVRLVVAGASSPSVRLADRTLWADAFETATYGGPADLFGFAALSRDDVLHAAFGAAVQAAYAITAGNARAWVDGIGIEIFYCPPERRTGGAGTRPAGVVTG